MSTSLNLAELVKIAGNIELEGQAFYSQAAVFTSNTEARELFSKLALMEGEHFKKFNSLLGSANADEFEQIIDPLNEAALYLDAVVGGDIFSKACTPEELAHTNKDNVDALFQFAIEREKDSIIFYTTLSKVYNNDEISSKIDIIIGEEISHVRFLCVARKKALQS